MRLAHHAIPENLPVNYQVLTALPMGVAQQAPGEDGSAEPEGPKNSTRFCEIHP